VLAQATLVTLGILGASLFYGDGMITPAISVLSAVAGLKVAAPSLSSLVLPITVVVNTLLFAIQRFGTQLVGNLFGPVMAVWFGVLALVGATEIAVHPEVIKGLSPTSPTPTGSYPTTSATPTTESHASPRASVSRTTPTFRPPYGRPMALACSRQLRLRQRDVLPLADHNRAGRCTRHEQVAQTPVPHHGPQRSQSRRLLQAP
jgi:K+ potassium transporter integral membrane domain